MSSAAVMIGALRVKWEHILSIISLLPLRREAKMKVGELLPYNLKKRNHFLIIMFIVMFLLSFLLISAISRYALKDMCRALEMIIDVYSFKNCKYLQKYIFSKVCVCKLFRQIFS